MDDNCGEVEENTTDFIWVLFVLLAGHHSYMSE